MDLAKLREKQKTWIGKYKYAMLILGVGILLMVLPARQESTSSSEQISEKIQIVPSQESRLEEILMEIEGAGKVRVMLTQAHGEETVYQTDVDSNQESESSSQRLDTVMVTDENRSQSGLIRQINPPEYLGAVVVCQGADQPKVKLAITEAVSKATNLGADQITVLKMK